MAFWEQYPDYAMMTDDQGERDTKAWVSGPSPLAMGLLTGGLGILAAPDKFSGWVSEGDEGFDPGNIARGGLLGLEAFSRGHQNLQDQRKDYYTHRSALMDQAIQNQTEKRKQEEYVQGKKLRESMITGLPNLLETLQKTNIPGIQSRIPALMAQAQAGDIKGAYQVATNLNSQLAKVTKDKPETITMDNGQKIMVQKDSAGGYSVVPGQSFGKSDNPFGGSLKGKAHGIWLNALSGTPGYTKDDPRVIAAYELLGQPSWKQEYDEETGLTRTIKVPGYVPPSFKKFMEGSSGISTDSADPYKEGIITKKKDLTKTEGESAGYANRMQKSMYEMDTLMAKGYRPSRTVLEFIKLGAPEHLWGRGEKEIYRLQMSPDDRIFARAGQDWLRAKLREESGAVIGIAEASEEVEAFFNVLPVGSPESPLNIYDTFRNSRISALESMIGQSGNAWARWKELKYKNKPRSSTYFYENSPFQKKVLTKKQKIQKRFKP